MRVRSVQRKLPLLLGIVVLSVIISTSGGLLIGYFGLPAYYRFVISIIGGGLIGWFIPLDYFYEKKFNNLRQTFWPGPTSLSTLYIELIIYKRIKKDDMLLVNFYSSWHYGTGSNDPLLIDLNTLVHKLENIGIKPKLILQSKGYHNANAIFFKDNQDYILAKLTLQETSYLRFFRGKELLDQAENHE